MKSKRLATPVGLPNDCFYWVLCCQTTGNEPPQIKGLQRRLSNRSAAIALLAAFWFGSTQVGAATAADATRLVTAEAKRQGVPVGFALRVARVESGVQCGKIGKAGERGPVQILPRTAAALGYHGIDKSACARQTAAGIRHLAICLQKGRSLHRAAACHNGGFGMLGRRNWPKSVRRYVSKVVR